MKSLVFVAAFLAVAFWYWGIRFVSTILIISFLVFFHELGHFLVAKYFKVCVKVFSIGFGEKLFIKKIDDTEYAISAIPLGGYVQLKGQNDADPSERNYDPDSYNSLSPIKRIAILFAGPFFNIILAFLLYIGVGFLGTDKYAPIVGSVLEGSAAQSANIQKGDQIIAINGIQIKEWDEIKPLIGLNPVHLEILRQNEIINLNLTPKISDSKNIFGENIRTPLIGIRPSGEFVKIYHTGFDSIKFAFDETIKASKLTYQGLYKVIEGVVSPKDLGGIVAIADITTKASAIGISVLFMITALISVNLGLLNLLPLPVLDGGHIVFNLYEMIFRREVNEKVFVALSYGSMALLLMLMAFTIINDILRLSGAYN
nr:RIP metalloprotease RseP [Campylobacter sp.]